MLNFNGTIATLHKFLPHLTVNLLPKGNTLRHFYNNMFPVFPTTQISYYLPCVGD